MAQLLRVMVLVVAVEVLVPLEITVHQLLVVLVVLVLQLLLAEVLLPMLAVVEVALLGH
jgi:hypothetical protein